MSKPSNSPRPTAQTKPDLGVIILGAGLSGRLVAHALRALGYRHPIQLVDPRQNFGQPQRWCFFGETPTLLPHRLVNKTWSAWRMTTREGRSFERKSALGYRQIESRHFYQWSDQLLASDSRTELILGESAQIVSTEQTLPVVQIGNKVTQADWCVDATGKISLAESQSSEPLVWQSFIGRRIVCRNHRWSPQTFDWMDFRTPQNEETRFAYVLPYSPQDALVELTSFSLHPPSHQELNRSLNDFILARGWSVAQILDEESGCLPMTTRPLSPNQPRVLRAGVAGGAARPSTGYAFSRTAQQTGAIAKIIAQGAPASQAHFSNSWLDRVFLRALAQSPGEFSTIFAQLFQGTQPGQIERFLSNRGTLGDVMAVVAALPKLRFMAAALPLRSHQADSSRSPWMPVPTASGWTRT